MHMHTNYYYYYYQKTKTNKSRFSSRKILLEGKLPTEKFFGGEAAASLHLVIIIVRNWNDPQQFSASPPPPDETLERHCRCWSLGAAELYKKTLEYTGASKRKSSWPNYWHRLCSTDCGQILLAGISTGTNCKKYKLQFFFKKAYNNNLAIAMKYNLATIINKLGMNNSIQKVRQPFPWARTHLLLTIYVTVNKRSKLPKTGLGLVLNAHTD